MFESSPGRNMRFEMSPFKMSEEMIEILGGGDEREPFKQFMELGVKAFLAARLISSSIFIYSILNCHYFYLGVIHLQL